MEIKTGSHQANHHSPANQQGATPNTHHGLRFSLYQSHTTLIFQDFSQSKGKIWSLFLVGSEALMLCLSLGLVLVPGV